MRRRDRDRTSPRRTHRRAFLNGPRPREVSLSILLKNLRRITLVPPRIDRADLRIDNGLIAESRSGLQPRRGEKVVDCCGKFVLPGFVCAHTHLYSSLSRGMPPPAGAPTNFLDVLRRVWWKLDRALDEESIYASALVGGLDALRCGTTTIVDHHASPGTIRGSLDIVGEALGTLGLRGVLCYEVTDRGGRKERDDGLAENERFLRSKKQHPLLRGLVGAHAAFTMSNESLRLCGELAASTGTGVHIHAAEDRCDIADAEENYCCTLLDRLETHGILRHRSILAHGVHFTSTDCSRIRDAGSWLVHNPRSNMNNKVGRPPVELFGERAALGTDGFPADMLAEASMGFFRGREGNDAGSPASMSRFLYGGQNLASEIFGIDCSGLAPGSAADLVVMEYLPPTPVSPDNLEGHLLFGMHSSMIESVMVNGAWVMKNREVVGVDLGSVMERAAATARKLWKRMERIRA